ncbi:MAG: AI-2E family transporter [Anaerolineae bacterium]
MSTSWSPTNRYFVLTLVLGALLWFLIVAGDLIGPLAISAFLAYLLNPTVTFVNRRTKLKRNWVVLLVYLSSLALLVAAAVILLPIIPQQISNLVAELQSIITQVEEVLSQPINVLGVTIPLNNLVSDTQMLSADFVRPDVIVGLLQATGTNLGWLLVILVTTYYLLQDWPRLREWLFRLAPPAHRPDMRRLYGEIRLIWQLYLRGQLRLMLMIGVITWLSTAAIGLPGALAMGVLAGILDIILTVGPTIAMVIAAAVALFEGSTYLPISNGWFTIIVVALYTLIKTVEDVWLRPRIMGHSLNLHPAVVLIAIIGALALAGVMAALIVIPLLSSASVIVRYLYCKILDIDPWEERA